MACACWHDKSLFGRGSLKVHFVFHALAAVGDLVFLIFALIGSDPRYSKLGDEYVYLTIWALTMQLVYFIYVAGIDLLLLRRSPERRRLDSADATRPLTPRAEGGDSTREAAEQLSLVRAQSERGEQLAVPSRRHGLGEWRDRLTESDMLLLWIADRAFALLFTVNTAVALLYWTLIFPADPEAHGFEFVRNLWDHGVTWLLIIAESLLVRHRLPTEWWRDPAHTMIFAIVYLVWNVITFEVNGYWPYPSFQPALADHIGVALVGYTVLIVAVSGLNLLQRQLLLRMWGGPLPSTPAPVPVQSDEGAPAAASITAHAQASASGKSIATATDVEGDVEAAAAAPASTGDHAA